MWFLEDSLTPCAVFGLSGLLLLFLGLHSGVRRQTRIGMVLLLIAVSALIVDSLVETDREVLQTRVVGLCDDFRFHRPKTVEYFSESAPELKGIVTLAMELVTVETEPSLTDFQIQVTNEGTRATTHFRANATISLKNIGEVGHQPSRFILTWANEKGIWKIIKVQRMHPLQNKELGLLDQSAG